MSTAAAHTDTPGRILAAAARLYATLGVGATSLRAIVQAAGVNLNAVHYHFGSKALVTRALFERIMQPIHAERLRLLDAQEAAGATVAGLVRAVYWPLVRRGGAGPASATRRGILVASQLRHDPSAEARAILADNQARFAPRFERLLVVATGLDEPTLRHPIRFINAAGWGLASQPALLDDALAGPDRATRLERLFDEFIAFAEAGLAAAQTTGSARNRQPSGAARRPRSKP